MNFVAKLKHSAENLRVSVVRSLPDNVINNSSRITSGFTLAANTLTAVSGGIHGSSYRLGASIFDSALLGLGVAFKEIPQTQAEIETLSSLPTTSYCAKRILQSLQPKKNIRQTLGMGFIITGAGLIAAGYNSEPKRYGEMVVGAQVISAGLVLTFSLESKPAWQRFGVVLASLQPTGAINAAESAIKSDDYWILAAQSMHLMTALTSWFIGGESEAKELAKNRPVTKL